jgi:hypothetical protein
MDLKTTVNSIGILLTIIGVYIVFKNSPINFNAVDGGNASSNYDEHDKIIKRANWWLRAGVYIVMIGSILQLISNYII